MVMNIKKTLCFLMLICSVMSARTDFNINLTIPAATGKTLPQYKTYGGNPAAAAPMIPHDATAPQIDLNGVPYGGVTENGKRNKDIKRNKNVKENKTKKGPVIQKDLIQAGNVKVVSGNVIDNLNPRDPSQNICEAFIADNSNNAFDYGYKEGVKYTKIYIGKFLLKHKKELDILFPLKQLYLNDGILQPPLVGKEDKGSYIYENGNTYRQYGVKYYIKNPARFVTKNSYRKWEDFLLDYPMEYYKNASLDNVLKFSINVKYSNSYQCNLKIRNAVYKKFREGFTAGEREVFLLMSARLKKLQSFVDGLYLYNELYYRGIINPPLISEFIEPVYKNKNGKILVINEKVLKIVKPASFNTETKKWKTFLITNDKVTVVHLKVK